MNGVLVIDKPSGPTSHDVVARVRRAIGIDRIGHTGTLDPLATGVLPLVIGRATRLAQYLTAEEKEYVAGIRFGATSATYDALGSLTPSKEAANLDITPAILEPELTHFRGSYEQIPPPFSAKKIGGTRAYRLARSQQPVSLKPVQVAVTQAAARVSRRRDRDRQARLFERLLRPEPCARPRTADWMWGLSRDASPDASGIVLRRRGRLARRS